MKQQDLAALRASFNEYEFDCLIRIGLPLRLPIQICSVCLERSYLRGLSAKSGISRAGTVGKAASVSHAFKLLLIDSNNFFVSPTSPCCGFRFLLHNLTSSARLFEERISIVDFPPIIESDILSWK